MDVLNQFSFSNRFAKKIMQETWRQTGFALCCKNETGWKLCWFQTGLLNQTGLGQFLDQTGSSVKPV